MDLFQDIVECITKAQPKAKPKAQPKAQPSGTSTCTTLFSDIWKSEDGKGSGCQYDNLTQEELVEIKELLSCLSQKTCDERESWFKITCALKSRSEELFDVWDEWSKQSDNYNEEGNFQTWSSLKTREGGTTIASLYYYAKQDNPDAFFLIKKRQWIIFCQTSNLSTARKIIIGLILFVISVIVIEHNI